MTLAALHTGRCVAEQIQFCSHIKTVQSSLATPNFSSTLTQKREQLRKQDRKRRSCAFLSNHHCWKKVALHKGGDFLGNRPASWQYPGAESEPSTSGRPFSASATLQRERENTHAGSMDNIHSGLPSLDRESLVEEDTKRDALPSLKTEFDHLMAHYVPVYVMLPLDCVRRDNVLSYPELLLCNLRALKAAGVDGVMVDVWWGIVEASEPRVYDWSSYTQLFHMVQSVGLKVQVVMSFHQCGGNTGDSCYIPLPPWVLEVGSACPDIFFTNQDRQRNREYLSFGVDEEPVLAGRTGVQVYYDFMKSFREAMAEFLDSGLVTEIEVGLGPAGELRYPSYPETHGWRFPGIGEFQCYDRFLLAQLRDAANAIGQFEWGYWGPHDAGRYNDWPDTTGFFSGSFSTDYGRFFLEWYATVLLKHGDRVLEAATDVFAGCRLKLAAKVAGIHWWYNSKNHAAELAAGYYNLRERDGYRPIAKMLARHYATLNFTCVEMRNDEQHWEARCGPEGLVSQVLNAGWQEGLEVACENALPRYDWSAFEKIVANARPDGINPHGPPSRRISAFTFLRMGPDLLEERNWNVFVKFVRKMHVGLDYHPEPEEFWRPRSVLRRSKPSQAMAPDGPVFAVPANTVTIPLAPSSPPDTDSFFSTDAPGGGLGVQVGEIAPPEAEEERITKEAENNVNEERPLEDTDGIVGEKEKLLELEVKHLKVEVEAIEMGGECDDGEELVEEIQVDLVLEVLKESEDNVAPCVEDLGQEASAGGIFQEGQEMVEIGDCDTVMPNIAEADESMTEPGTSRVTKDGAELMKIVDNQSVDDKVQLFPGLEILSSVVSLLSGTSFWLVVVLTISQGTESSMKHFV